MLTAQDFQGDWQLDRVITDRLGTMNGRLSGVATLTGNDAQMAYDETGRLTLATGSVMAATRGYLWTFKATRVVVRFADGADFHAFVPDGQAIGTTHLCGEDLYDVTYDFRDWPVWTATWSVKGPRKDYTSVSRYQRA